MCVDLFLCCKRQISWTLVVLSNIVYTRTASERILFYLSRPITPVMLEADTTGTPYVESFQVMGVSAVDPGKPKRDPEYYFQDGNIVFLVENHLFRVHRHFFVRESAVFSDMLSIPAPPDTVVEGDSDDKPIVLDGVKSNDFRSLLWMWYDPGYKRISSSANTWYAIMSLADRWQFENVGKVAFEAFAALPGVEAMEKIVVCETYGFKRSVISKAYWAICSRNYPLTYREAEKLGWVACVIIGTIRDRHGSFGEHQVEMKIAEFENYRK